MADDPTLRQLQERLAAAEAKVDELRSGRETPYVDLIGSWAQAVWETDAAGVVVSDSPSWRAYTGQTLEEWLGYGWLDAIHPDDRAYAERQWREAIAVRGLVNAEFRLRAPDGGWRWTNVRAAPSLGARGIIEKWSGINIDIDARKRAEAALRESEERYRTLLKSIDEGFCIIEMLFDLRGKPVDYRFLELNPVFEQQAGFSIAPGQRIREIAPDHEQFWFDVYGGIALTGQPERFEHRAEAFGIFYDVYAFRVDAPELLRVAVLFRDITQREQAEIAVRESQERQTFLLKLSDALRPLANIAAEQTQALNLLVEHLGLVRAAFYEIDADQNGMTLAASAETDAVAWPKRLEMSEFGAHISETYRAGKTYPVDNADTDLRLTEWGRAAIRDGLGIGRLAGVPLVKSGKLAAVLGIQAREPRAWRDQELRLLEEVADRTWSSAERARAEAALRESEERFGQFANASAAGLWIRAADSLVMEFTSPAIAEIYGIESGALLGDVKRWATMIVPEDRDAALAHLDAARAGELTIHEFRIQRPSDGAFRWIRNTDFALEDAEGRVVRIGGLAEDVTEAKLAVEHQDVLLAELQHRVRNIMAIIRSMALRTADGAVDVADYRSLFEGRLMALARVQVLLTREANAGGSLRNIITSEVSVQAHRQDQFELDGPEIRLSPKAVEVLTLALHELATNALKYGAFSVPDGRLRVSWAPFEKRGRTWLALDWTEAGAPPREPVRRRGFGSDLIEGRIPYELGGTGKITLGPGGAHCRLEFPLKDGESILATDAPKPATIFGGILDMTDAPDLTGRKVLVVEDDYYIAGDTVAALRGAGAEVLGPCPNEDAALDLLTSQMPTHAVLDLNLGGGGPKFEIARLLKARGVPFIFMTGYDLDMIPAELEDVLRLQKPVPFRKIVDAVSQL